LDEAIVFPKQPVMLGHRLTALAVAATMLILPVIYVLFVVGVAWLIVSAIRSFPPLVGSSTRESPASLAGSLL
jgi:hypothetical protein